MARRAIVLVAVFAYLAIFGCVAWSGADAPTVPTAVVENAPMPSEHSSQMLLKALPFRSVAMQVQRVDWIDKYKKSIDEIAAVGADTVLLVVDARQENGESSRIYLDMRMTPTPDQLGALIRHAKERKLRVILMPIVLLDNPTGNEWRGTLAPRSWDDWFDSYRDMIGHFAWIAQGTGVDMLVVGSELVSSEKLPEQWDKTIRSVREIYHGLLTYSSNWDHYTAVPFWNELDLIGMNSYWKMGKDHNVTVPQIKARWGEIQRDLKPFVEKTGKPLMFLEVGWCSLANAAHEPWDYTKVSEPIDLDLQRRLYEAFFEAWYGKPWLGGFSIWEWPPGDGGAEDRGYTPENKPAEKVLRRWLEKPRWTVGGL